MTKTVNAYRAALEGEIKKWNGYERVLRRDINKFFEELMNISRSLCLGGQQRRKRRDFSADGDVDHSFPGQKDESN
jgi:hypothetical protein